MELEKFCGVDLTSSDQHLKISDSRFQRDTDDCRKMVEWFKHYNPVPENSNLISMNTGVVGNSRINFHMAKEESILGIKRIEGSAKCAERNRRTRKQVSSEAMFDEAMITTVYQEKILTNPKNRDRLISIPMNKFSSLSMARRDEREIAAVGRPDCFVQCCVFIVGTTAITGRFK
ncbi:hypothetical protein AVEN_31735-1 [Araneus ventricosus]|uniref:Uncharacterized protein n=1 Tax=Araneus ventricosus TaxID=182803 RepID=A0A4Y2K207_ARAVE|nr:hypothetical protein AVEN_31735-1 [Araneus ventricosus]